MRQLTVSVPFFILTLCLVFMLGGTVTFAVLQFTVRIGSTANIKAVGLTVWRDQACTVPLSSIDWGVLAPGESRNVTAFMRNEGNVPATFSMTTESWSPAAAGEYITLVWDYSGVVVQPKAVLKAVFTLTVSPYVQGVTVFSFIIVVAVSEAG